MRSTYIQKIYDIAEAIEAKEAAKCKKTGKMMFRKKFNRSVLLCLEEGSILYLDYSFVETYEDENGKWFIIFSEHHDTHIYHESDIDNIRQFPPQINIEKAALP